MLKVDYHLNIEVSQGDSGCLFFGSNPYTFEGGELLEFEILLGDEIMFSKKSNIVDRGLLFLELTPEETRSLPTGVFKYRVYVEYNNKTMQEYVINSRDIRVKEG